MPIDRTVSEGDVFAGFRVVATPGHTGGHTSLLSDRHGLLFTADAYGSLPLTPSGKARVGVRKFLCTDPTEAQRFAEKLLEEEFEMAVFSHGKPLREGAWLFKKALQMAKTREARSSLFVAVRGGLVY